MKKNFILLTLLATGLTAMAADQLPEGLDYSYCGYHASADTLPLVPARISVAWHEGDMTADVQEAIDFVSSLPMDKNGHRGTVQLEAGTYQLNGRLAIEASGVVLRGAGRDLTILRKVGVDRGSALRIEGRDDRRYSPDTLWVKAYVKLGTRTLTVDDASQLKAGQEVEIVRLCTWPWIDRMKCRIYGGGLDALAWKPGDVELHWRRTLTATNAGSIELDAPLTMEFDPEERGEYLDNKKKLHQNELISPCFARVIIDNGRIRESGIENLTIDSDYNPQNRHDENHCWTGISIEQAADCWVRQVNFRHLAGSAVVMQPTTQRITVEDCMSLEPVSEDAGLRRCSFYVMGQQCLVQRCLAREARHAFVTGFCAAGPNAFVQCEAQRSTSYSGGLDSWACGTLYDIVDIDGHDLVLKNLGQDNNGAGWNAAASTCWQCTAAEVHCYAPDEANRNRAFGTWSQFSGDGEWASSNNHIQPRSLYYAQLAARLKADVTNPQADSLLTARLERQGRILYRSTDASSSPTVEKAQEMARIARTEPRQTLEEWIKAGDRHIDTQVTMTPKDAKALKAMKARKGHGNQPVIEPQPIAVVNGHLTQGGSLLLGGRYQTPWWNGKLRPSTIANPVMTRPALTRFVPDREGLGFTDRIDSVVAFMQQEDILAWDQNYGLWYDRRRDDHERVRRRDAAVWAPFWEQPWANTGEGEAWNGLSLYDLTQPNTWYYQRLHDFAQQTAPMGKLLYLEHYFQHNILEAGAHWVDSPWRPVNNVNQTVFPEPVPFTGDKRVFVAEWFYDEANATMRELHRQYIRRNLEAFADLSNVIHYISEEYTGPLHFTRFWVETIREWEQETGRRVLVALAATKDVQDSILADPELSQVIDIIDIRYWHYKTKPDPGTRKTWDDGKDIFDPAGGVNLAPRQHMRQQPVGKVRFEDAYRAVSEYRQRYPEKAVVYYAQNYPDMGWAVLMAGGSASGVKLEDARLRAQLCDMQIQGAADRSDAKVLQSADAALIYGLTTTDVLLNSLNAGRYLLSEIDSKTGSPRGKDLSVTVGQEGSYTLNIAPNHVYWLRKR